MGNVLMSCYFSVLILAICKKCRLVLASGAPSSPCETKEDVPPPIAKEKRDVCTSFASSPSITKEDVSFKVQQAKAKAKVLSVVDTDETDSVIYYYHQNQRQDLELKQFSNGSFLGPQRKKTTCTQRNRWRKEDCFKLDLQFVLQFKTCRIKSMTKFFFKNKSYSFHHLHHYHRPNHHHCHYFVLLL